MAHEKTTYHLEPKKDLIDNPVEFEVGDSKQAEFQPQVKMTRWGNRANLSVRLIHDEIVATCKQNGETVEWKAGDQKVDFYSVPDSEETPSGAFEVDVTLYDRPVNDRLQFSLRYKGIKFYLQPALSEEQIAEGDTCADNIPGSWAIWAVDLSGKFGHIYNSLMMDAAGNTTRTNPQITDNGDGTGTLTINFDKKFLDNAVYPIRHAAGLTLGSTVDGGTGQSLAANRAHFRKVTAAASGAVSDFNLRLATPASGGSSGENIKGVIWDYSSLAVISNGVSPSIDNVATPAIKSANFSPQPSVVNGTSYYIGYVPNYTDGNGVVTYDTGVAGDGGRHTANSYSSPTTIGTIVNNDRIFGGLWMTYGGAPDTTSFFQFMG